MASPAVEQLRSAIDSISKVELLEFFHKNRSAVDTAEQLAIWAGRDAQEVGLDLEALAQSGILKREGEGTQTLYFFRPTPEMEAILPEFLESARKGPRRTEILKIEKENSALRAMSRRLEEEIEARSKDLDELKSLLNDKVELVKLLQKTMNIILAASDEADLFDRLGRELAAAVGVDAAAFLLLDEGLKAFLLGPDGYPQAHWGWIVDEMRRRFEGVLPASLIPQETIKQILPTSLGPTRPFGSPRLLLHVPVYREKKPTGLIGLVRPEAGAQFRDEDGQLLEIVAAQLSIALESFYNRAQVQRLAITDDLTGIYNKRQFRTTLRYEFDRARIYGEPLSLLMLDIDHFKRINDTFGHGYGDIVLSELCGTVRQQLRPTDTFARYGGEEFAVIVPHTARDGALTLAERVRKSVEECELPPPESGEAQRITVSIGSASWDEGIPTPDDLVALADRHLYRSKNSGRNRVSG